MKQYILKSAALSEIERLRKNQRLDDRHSQGVLDGLHAIEIFIDTLEVKEVGVDYGDSKGDKSTNSLIDIKALEVKEVDFTKELQTFSMNLATKVNDGNWDKDIAVTAKHFFELGLKASNPITAADRGTAEEIIINLKRVEKDYHINLTREIEWLRNKVKKGK